jgi:hypothetical protein
VKHQARYKTTKDGIHTSRWAQILLYKLLENNTLHKILIVCCYHRRNVLEQLMVLMWLLECRNPNQQLTEAGSTTLARMCLLLLISIWSSLMC